MQISPTHKMRTIKMIVPHKRGKAGYRKKGGEESGKRGGFRSKETKNNNPPETISNLVAVVILVVHALPREGGGSQS